jgi:phospholipid-translocating ATPase
MTLLGVTGVEDKLEDAVAETLEALEAANIRVWMLTGDKAETAICVALSARLFCRDNEYVVLSTYDKVLEFLAAHSPVVPPLVIDGTAMQQAFESNGETLVETLLKAPAIAVCRCSPSQKEDVVRKVRQFSSVVTCAVGDGGNDVAMIQAASVGIGIVGKEGKQASLAADCSINMFAHLQRLLLWHGTNCYKHSSRLGQFVMHRGVIMATTQAVFSLLYNFVPAPLYNDWLMMNFATFFTNFSVLSLCFDQFIEPTIVMKFPELYRTCQKGRCLSAKTFIGWTILAIYQGAVIVFMTVVLFPVTEMENRHFQSVAFTSLVLTELGLIAMNINMLNCISIGAEFCSLFNYLLAVAVIRDAFDLNFILSFGFAGRITIVTTMCLAPLAIFEVPTRVYAPSHEEGLRRGSSRVSDTQFVIL